MLHTFEEKRQMPALHSEIERLPYRLSAKAIQSLFAMLTSSATF
jgi:hypothetical protein